MGLAGDCVLSLLGHDPDEAPAEARAGAVMVAESLLTFQALVAGLAKAGGGRKRKG